MSTSRPKKPKAHHSSFIHRIHQRHDQRHHAGEDRHPENEASRPLLQEDHPESDSDIAAEETEQTSTGRQEGGSHTSRRSGPVGRVFDALSHRLAKMANTTSRVVQAGFSNVMASSKQLVQSSKQRLNNVGNTIHRNPKRALAALCIFLAVATSGEAVELYRQYRTQKVSALCTTPACVEAAANILQNMHPEHEAIDPCNDFDKYVCGGFRTHNDLSKHQSALNSETVGMQDVHRSLRLILEQSDIGMDDDELQIFQKIQDAYKACMDEHTIRSFGLKPLKSYTDEIKALFSKDRNALRKSTTFQSIVIIDTDKSDSLTLPYISLMKMGVNALISLTVKVDNTDHDIQKLYAAPAPLWIPFHEAVSANDDSVQVYQSIIESVLIHFIDDRSNKSMVSNSLTTKRFSAAELAEAIVLFESNLFAIIHENQASGGLAQRSHWLTFDEFDRLLPQLSLWPIVREFAPSSFKDTSILVSSPAYLERLSLLLSTTQSQVLQAFFIWKIIQEHASWVEDKALVGWKQFESKFSPVMEANNTERWITCVDNISTNLPWIFMYFYSKQIFTQQSKDQASLLFQMIRRTFDHQIDDKEWLSQKDREMLANRTKATNLRVGYSEKDPHATNAMSVTDFYHSVVISNNTFLSNRISAIHNDLYHRWVVLGQSVLIDQWPVSPKINSPVFSKYAYNYIPATIMRQPFFFQPDTPSYLNYGAFGAAVGHTIAQALNQDYGSPSAIGFSQEHLSNSARKVIKHKTACFIQQYSNFSVSGPDGPVQVDGQLSLEDNVADAGGVRAAYQAWAQNEISKKSLKLPGLTAFRNEQLFWLSYGSSMCSMMKDEAAIDKATNSSRLPNFLRLKGVSANSKAFKEAFDCPVKQPVCQLW